MVAGVDRDAGEVQQVCGPQLGKQQLVQALPDLGLVPVPQPSPAGHPRTEARFLGHPADAGAQHDQDPAQYLVAIKTPATWTPRIIRAGNTILRVVAGEV